MPLRGFTRGLRGGIVHADKLEAAARSQLGINARVFLAE